MFTKAKFFAAFLAAGIVVGGSAGVLAQSQLPERLGEYKDWGAFRYATSGGNACYALSVPLTKLPANVDHGDNFFLVTQRVNQNITFEPQVMAGYSLRDGSKVTVTIDGKEFAMFTKGNSAWLENAAQEPALVAAMKAGAKMTVNAVSARGTNTTYEYSLSGVTAALDAIKDCK